MLARVAWRELTFRPLRSALALAGVAVATAMLVDMLMLGRGIQTSFGELLGASGYELRVAPKGTLPFDTEATIAAFPTLEDSLTRVDGVAHVAPALAAAVEIETVGVSATRAVALGIVPDRQGLLRVTEGSLPVEGEVVIDAYSADRFGLTIGQTLEVRVSGGFGLPPGAGTVSIAGFADFLYAADGDVGVALTLPQLQRLTGAEGEVSFAMIQVPDDHDPAVVRNAILSGTNRVEVVTLGDILQRAGERLSYFRQLALILGSVSLIVAALLVGTIMAVSVNERLGTISALRAIGIPRVSILRALSAESTLLCAIGGGLGILLGVLVAGRLDRILSDFPGLPVAVRFFVVDARSLVVGYALLIGVGMLAGLLPALRATRLEVSTLLRSDQP